MGKPTYTYIFIRVLFGLYLIYHGYSGYQNLNNSLAYFYQTIDSFDRRFIKPNDLPISFNSLKSSSPEILSVANFIIMLGGYFAIFGYQISKYFVAMGMMIDFVFVHNFLFLRDGKMLNYTIKALSILGGALVVH